MKPIVLSMLSMLSFLIMNAQNICEDPVLKSLSINTKGELADYQTNCCPPTNDLTAVQMSDSAGVTSAWYNDNYVFLNTHSLASFTMGPWATALVPSAADLMIKLPRTVTEDVSGTKNTAEKGTIGIAVDGVVIFSETTSDSYNTSEGNNTNGDGIWNEDAWVDEAWSLDTSGRGHTNASGKYHYHASPTKLYSATNTGHSPIVGWALDGTPIYGPFGYSDSLNSSSTVVRMESGYQLRNITDRTTLPDGTILTSNQYGPAIASYALGTYVEDYEHIVGLGHLDEHNGRWCVTPDYPSGVYAYFITEDAAGTPKFPYFIGPEFYGTTASGNSIPGNAVEFDPLGCLITGTNDSDQSNSFFFYPNPTTGNLVLDLSKIEGDKVTVNIATTLGQTVYTSSVAAKTRTSLQLHLDAGLYQLKVVSGDETYSEVLVVK